jgi:hypothetical protein
VVGALFTCLELHEERWLDREGSEPLPRLSDGALWSEADAPLDPAPLAESFRSGVRDLRPVLESILDAATRAEIERVTATEGGPPDVTDDLWVEVLGQFAAAYHREVIHKDHAIRALVPLYLGRVASFLSEKEVRAGEPLDERLEALGLAFEKGKPLFVKRWRAGEGS